MTSFATGKGMAAQGAYEVLRQLSGEQLAATARLLIWMNNTTPTEAQVRQKMARTFRGDRQFASVVVAALEATRQPGPARKGG
jgi:beta-phosphoglucomutase-like phosphatase (HAD superfamily)